MTRPLLLVLVVVAVLVVTGLDHGLPHRYVPDDSAVKCALGIARDAGSVAAGEAAGSAAEPAGGGLAPATPAGPLGPLVASLPDRPRALVLAAVPPAGRYTTYPYLLPYLDLAAIGVRFAAGRLTGEWGGAGAFAEAVFDDARLAWLPARWVSALFALLLPLAVARVATEMGRARGESALAGLLAGTSLLCVQYAHTTRPWIAVVALGACTLAAAMRLRRRRGTGAALLAFGLAGLTGAAHQLGLLAVALPLVAALLWRVGWWRALLGLAFGGLVALAVGYPFLLVHGLATGAGSIVDAPADAVQIGGQAFDADAFSGELFRPVLRSWLGYDPVLVVLGPLGWLYLMRPVLAWRWILLVVPAMIYALLFLFYDGTHVRYLMPVVPALAVGAAGVLGALSRGTSRLVALAIALFPIVQAARLDWVLVQTDTRTLAAEVIVQASEPDDVLAVDAFGSYYGPPLVPRPETVARWAGQVETTRSERRALELAAAGVPPDPAARHVVPVARYWRFDSYYPTDHLLGGPLPIDQWMRDWDVDLYVQVDRVPDARRRAPVTALTAARGELLLTISPTGSQSPERAELPTDMDFALRDVWRYERPGPLVRVWRLVDGAAGAPAGSAEPAAPARSPAGDGRGDEPAGDPGSERSDDVGAHASGAGAPTGSADGEGPR